MYETFASHQFQIEPNGEQRRAMRQLAGNTRKVWNLALDRQQKNQAAGEKFTHVFGMNNWLPAWRKEFPFLQNSPAPTLQQVMADLGCGYKSLFDSLRNVPPPGV